MAPGSPLQPADDSPPIVNIALGVAGGAQFLNIDNASEPDNYLHLVYGIASIAVGRLDLPARTARAPHAA